LIESVACFLITGFVVFRFYEVGTGKSRKVVPIVVPITEIQWMYETGDLNYESDLVLPEITVPAAGFANKTRFYMYKFRNFNGISSTSLGIAFTLVEAYKKWKLSETYNEILQRENIKTSVFVEQRTVTDTSVVGGMGAHSVASAPLISRLTENSNFRSTTHAPVLATPTEEIRESIEVIFFWNLCSRRNNRVHELVLTGSCVVLCLSKRRCRSKNTNIQTLLSCPLTRLLGSIGLPTPM